MHDIIPDIHGQADKLTAALRRLGYNERNGAWRHSDPNRICVFLGDFIDRGPNNAEVIRIVRSMVEAGSAKAIMGNHELNAIHFHSMHPVTGKPLREHSEKNWGQHESFLREFPIGEKSTAEAIEWMRALPLFLNRDGFRVVHACWDDEQIRQLHDLAPSGVLDTEQLVMAADPKALLHDLLEVTTKGPETQLPEGYSFIDKHGHKRNEVRLQWWKSGGRSWAEVSMSVPNPDELPRTPFPTNIPITFYPADANPVFFGHYWLDGGPTLQSVNALCLDYSAGTTGPLVTYLQEAGQTLSLDNVVVHAP
jgi:hypothetical protein